MKIQNSNNDNKLDSTATASPDLVVSASCNSRLWWISPTALGVFILGLVADQLTKVVVTTNLMLGESWPLNGFFRFTYTRNTGTIFGLLQGHGLLLTIVSFVALGAILLYFRGSVFPSRLTRIALGMMLGGAVGNLVDRLRHGFVVDFVDVGPWPIFNLADSMIVVGIGIVLWTSTFRTRRFDHQIVGDDATVSQAVSSDMAEKDKPENPEETG